MVTSQYYVHDWNDGFQYFDAEKDAKDMFDKILKEYTEEAIGDEWQDEVEHLSWGIIKQTVKLKKVTGDIYESTVITHPVKVGSDKKVSQPIDDSYRSGCLAESLVKCADCKNGSHALKHGGVR